MKLNYTNALILLALTGSVAEAATQNQGKASLDFRLRYENVDQDNALKDADALTLRTTLNYKTAGYSGFSGFVEFEDSRVVGSVDDYNNTLGDNTQYSVIADPETTELDQGYLQYSNKQFTAKVGRQVVTLDGHRFVGHVAWRQDKQTFDAASFVYKPNKNSKYTYVYIDKRNRIFADEKDFDAKDHLINASFSTDAATLTAYSYMLEIDEGADNSLDTYGVSLVGKYNGISYAAEYASQESETGNVDYDADYIKVEGGYSMEGVSAKLGMEILGSDDSKYGFSTPLATLHKFNGWADQFLNTPKEGLNDIYVSFAGKMMGGKWSLAYHDYSADEDTKEVDDLGDEINAVYTKVFAKKYTAGIKYASYSAGDSGAGKVDADKVWLWVQTKF